MKTQSRILSPSHDVDRKWSGTIEDVASFCCVAARTMHDWNDMEPPVFAFFQEGRSIFYPEESVIDGCISRTLNARAFKALEDREFWRMCWRNHLTLRRTAAREKTALEAIAERLEKIEKQLTADRTDIARAA